MVRKNKTGMSSFIMKIIVFAIVLGILAAIILLHFGKEQVGQADEFWRDRFFNTIGVKVYDKINLYSPIHNENFNDFKT